ncbi:SDR family oxidoreductase [Virgibacillus dakarensis]|nr:SDR family oxidoreductase [Virgibacillus dakarensis]
MHGKRVLVTGAASGIGKGIAEKFLLQQAKVILLDKNEALLHETMGVLGQKSEKTHAVVCDISKEDQLQSAIEQSWAFWGGLDILINNAGLAIREPFIDISTSNWDLIMNTNVRATFKMSQMITKKMIKNNIAGSIVNITSKNGLSGSSSLAHYNTSKAGINLLTQSMAVELAKYGIRVNAVAPGFIETPLDQTLKQEENLLEITDRTPMKRMGTCEEVSNGVFFLASEEASYITGTTLIIDGGHLANASEF